ncbi:MAG: hypothetical protein KDD44_07325 [Bdellovibrionales bacterium]|nr:hypothetical protein [Bdellovibrionales bacterium]
MERSKILIPKLSAVDAQELTMLGFSLGGETADGAFCIGWLPSGWAREGVVTHLVALTDEKGRHRVYLTGSMTADSSLDWELVLLRRFEFRWVGLQEICMICDRATGDILWCSGPASATRFVTPSRRKQYCRDRAIDWLDERFPDWGSAWAYWDRESWADKAEVPDVPRRF